MVAIVASLIDVTLLLEPVTFDGSQRMGLDADNGQYLNSV